MADLANRLLGATAGPVELVDLLFERARAAGHHEELLLAGLPSAETTLRQAKGGGAQKAITAAARHTDPEVLATLAKDSRITVRRAALGNPHTPLASKVAIVRAALRSGLKKNEHDGDTLELAGRVLPGATMLAVLDDELPNEHLPHLLGQLEPRTADELTAFLTCRFPVLRTNALEALATNRCEGMAVLDAVTLGEFPASRAAALLWEAGVPITPAVAELLLAGAAEDPSWPYRLPREPVRVTPDAAPMLMASGQEWFQAAALSAGLTDELLALLLAAPSHAGLRWACGVATTEAHAAALVPRVAMARREHRNALASPTRRFRYDTDEIHEADGLLERGLLHGKAALTLLRSGHLAVTCRWLAGQLGTKPQPGEIAALLARPGMALSPQNAKRRFVHMTHGEDPLLAAVEGKPWAPELYEHGTNFAEKLTTGWRSLPGALGYLADRLHAAFGVEPQLWDQFEARYRGFEGTVDSLTKLCLVSCGYTAPIGPRPAGPDLDAEARGQLF